MYLIGHLNLKIGHSLKFVIFLVSILVLIGLATQVEMQPASAEVVERPMQPYIMSQYSGKYSGPLSWSPPDSADISKINQGCTSSSNPPESTLTGTPSWGIKTGDVLTFELVTGGTSGYFSVKTIHWVIMGFSDDNKSLLVLEIKKYPNQSTSYNCEWKTVDGLGINKLRLNLGDTETYLEIHPLTINGVSVFENRIDNSMQHKDWTGWESPTKNNANYKSWKGLSDFKNLGSYGGVYLGTAEIKTNLEANKKSGILSFVQENNYHNSEESSSSWSRLTFISSVEVPTIEPSQSTSPQPSPTPQPTPPQPSPTPQPTPPQPSPTPQPTPSQTTPWSGTTIIQTDVQQSDWRIKSGDIVIIKSGVGLTTLGILTNEGIIQIEGTLYNLGTIENYGKISFVGGPENYIKNRGDSITNYEQGIIEGTNQGGTIDINKKSKLTNWGTIKKVHISSYGHVENFANIENSIIFNYGQFTNNGEIKNTDGVSAVINRPSGIFTNSPSGLIELNSNLVATEGGIINQGTIKTDCDVQLVGDVPSNIIDVCGETADDIGPPSVAGNIKTSSGLTAADPTKIKIPTWIKNNADWWVKGSIDDSEFLSGIEFMIKEEIIRVPISASSQETGDGSLPSWIKQNADWWAKDLISDEEFANAIKYLVEKRIIVVG